MLIINISNPRVTPPPYPEFSGHWKLSFSVGYLRIRGANFYSTFLVGKKQRRGKSGLRQTDTGK